MIGEKERYHGSALARLVQDADGIIQLEYIGGSAYRVDGNRYLFLKYSTKRLSPWSFTFADDQVAELYGLVQTGDRVVVVLICGSEGVAAVCWDDLRSTVDVDAGRFSIRASRRNGHQFRVGGGGSPPLVVAEVDFVRLAAGD